MLNHLQRWGAVWILLVLFIGSWAGQWLAQLHSGDDAIQVWASTFENWQSEWLQLLVQSILILALRHALFKADAEDTERLEKKLDEVLRKLDEVEEST